MYNSKVKVLSPKFHKEGYINVISKLPEQFLKISWGQFVFSFTPLIKINPFLISVFNIFLIGFIRISFKQYYYLLCFGELFFLKLFSFILYYGPYMCTPYKVLVPNPCIKIWYNIQQWWPFLDLITLLKEALHSYLLRFDWTGLTVLEVWPIQLLQFKEFKFKTPLYSL